MCLYAYLATELSDYGIERAEGGMETEIEIEGETALNRGREGEPEIEIKE